MLHELVCEEKFKYELMLTVVDLFTYSVSQEKFFFQYIIQYFILSVL